MRLFGNNVISQKYLTLQLNSVYNLAAFWINNGSTFIIYSVCIR